MGISGSKVGSWVKVSQSLPPYGIRAPPWQDVAAHAEHTTAGHQWRCAMMGCRSSPALHDSIARNPVPDNPGKPPRLSGTQRYMAYPYARYISPTQKHVRPFAHQIGNPLSLLASRRRL